MHSQAAASWWFPPFHALEAAKHGMQCSLWFIAQRSSELGSTPRPLVHRSPPSSHSGVNALSVGVSLLTVTVFYIPQGRSCLISLPIGAIFCRWKLRVFWHTQTAALPLLRCSSCCRSVHSQVSTACYVCKLHGVWNYSVHAHHSNVNSNLVISMKQNSVLLYLQLESSSDRTLSAHNGFLLLCKECRNRRTHLQRETLLSILQQGRTANSLSKLPAQRLMLEKVQSPRVSSVVYRLAFSLQILYASPRGGQIL